TGTLDGLVQLSDELVKTDVSYGGAVGKVVDVLRNLLQDEQVLSSMLTINDKSVDQYLKTFSWDSTKYRSDRPLSDICQTIAQQVSSIEGGLKTKLSEYNVVKNNLQALTRKQHGNLSIRGLADIVREEHVVKDSEYLKTLFVAVPNSLLKEWDMQYETITQMVVPRSATKVTQDQEYTLYSVVVFERVVDEFVNKCRENKFIVREYDFNPEQDQKDRVTMLETESEEKELQTTLIQWCHTSFGEVFSAWVHIKALRVFVESILRYGLPPDFISALVKPKPKSEKKIRDTLVTRYASLERALATNQPGKGKNKAYTPDDETHLDEFQHVLGSDYTPFVMFEVNWDVFDSEH
ncbi:Vacuolar ATP synthase subunit C, partial [Dimargaris verticillata]